MAQVASRVGLGLLVVDEIQRLSEAKAGGARNMLDFFTQMSNSIGVPIVRVGTHKVLPLLGQSLAQARRSVGQGTVFWPLLEKGSTWDVFLEAIWDYQWTKERNPLTKEVKE